MQIPKLTNDPKDTGDKFMAEVQRKIIAQKFEIPMDEYPDNLAERKQLMIILKAENPDLYNYWYDKIVRGVEPEEIKAAPMSVPQSTEIDIIAIKKKIKEAFIEMQTSMTEKLRDTTAEGVTAINTYAEITKDKLERHLVEQKNSLLVDLPNMVYAELQKIRKTVIEVKSISGSVILDEIVHEKFKTVLDLAVNRVNTLLVGPAGCGKTHLGFSVARALNLPFASQSCSAGISESIFSGWLLPVAQGGTFQYVQSEFVRIYENGGVFLFDEIDAADANVLLFLNQALANSGFTIPQRFEKPFVKKHPDFIAIAAANTYGTGGNITYSGRNLLDGASMDRFRAGIVTMNYSSAIESATVDQELLAIGNNLRILFNQKNIKKILSTRFLQDATKMKKYGWTNQEVFQSYFQDWSKGELDQIRGHLNGILS